MYRSVSRYETRSIQEKPSRSARSTWVKRQQNRSYATGLEEDDGGLPRHLYLAEDTHILDTGDYVQKGTSSGTALREAQRLAANFFSHYPSASTATEPVYRNNARLTRPLSPDAATDRYLPRGQNRDRDGVDRWNGRPNSYASFPSSISQLLVEDWEEDKVRVVTTRDLYREPASRWRKTEEVTWNDNDNDCNVVRKEAAYPVIQTAADVGGGLKVTKKLDWTGLLRPDGRRASAEDELNRQGSFYSRRGGGYFGTERHREVDVRKESRGYTDERLQDTDAYVLNRTFGSRGDERGGRWREEWKMPRETSDGQGQRAFDPERGRDRTRFDDSDSGRLFGSSYRYSGEGSGFGTGRGKGFPDSLLFGKGAGGSYSAKRDFSQRASITNQDILAVYYGNPGTRKQPSKFAPTRGYAHPGLPTHYTPSGSERYQPRQSLRSPGRGRPARHSSDMDLSRKSRKRWEKHTVDGSEGKRFKRETQSDKLYLMHNSRAKSEEKEQEASASLSVAERGSEDIIDGMGKGKLLEPALEDMQELTDAVVEGSGRQEPIKGLWDNEDSWSDSEDEEQQAQMTLDEPSTNEATEWGEPTGEEREHSTSQALQSRAVNNSNEFLSERSEDDKDDDGDWESLASDLDDQLDDVCVHQMLEADDAIIDPDCEGLVCTNSGAQASEEVVTPSVVQSQDSEMVDIDDNERSEEGEKEVAEVGSSVKGLNVGIEKPVVVVVEELVESVKNREDKAFDNYVSLFEQDTDLMKFYDAKVSCGSFECLVCAGVGAKKTKRFPDVASLVQHAKKILRTKKLPEHRGFARAMSKILGWETAPGPSVILPRGCIPSQQSGPAGLKLTAPNKQTGGGSTVRMDWEWDTARQLFEEQEARIDLWTRSSGVLLQAGSTATSRLPSPRDRMGPDTAQGADFVGEVETSMTLQKTTKKDVISSAEKASVNVFTGLENSSLIEAVSEPVKRLAAIPVETASAEALKVPAKSAVLKTTSVPAETLVGESLSLTHSSILPGPSLVYEISTVARDVKKDLSPSPSETVTGTGSPLVEMWAPLPLEEVTESKMKSYYCGGRGPK